MPADLDSLFGDDDFNIDDSPDEMNDWADDLPEEGGADTNFEDMFRETATRSESTYDDMGFDDEEYLEEEPADSGSGGGGFSIRNFTPFQILILVLLIILDFAAIGFGILVLMGRIA